jgi:hypothetical protein
MSAPNGERIDRIIGDHDLIDCGVDDPNVRAFVISLVNQKVRPIETELGTLRKDIEGAAGELMVPVPEPGSIASKMLLANRIMFRERDALRERLAKLETAIAGPNELDILDARAGQFGY